MWADHLSRRISEASASVKLPTQIGMRIITFSHLNLEPPPLHHIFTRYAPPIQL